MQLSAAPFLQKKGMSLESIEQCPECKTSFMSGRGFVYPTHYMKGEEQGFGLLNFCSILCILQWVDIEHECGHS